MYANIDRVYEEGASELGTLKKPFRIEMSKSPVISSYKVVYYGVSELVASYFCCPVTICNTLVNRYTLIEQILSNKTVISV